MNGNNSNDDSNDMIPDSADMPMPDLHPGVVAFGQFDADSAGADLRIELDAMPVLPTRDLVLFPGVVVPIMLGRDRSLSTVKAADEQKIAIAVVCQRRASDENPAGASDLYGYGVLAQIVKVLDLPDGTRTAIVRGMEKVRVLGDAPASAIRDALALRVKTVREPSPSGRDKEFMVVAAEVRDLTLDILKRTGGEKSEFAFNIGNLSTPVECINYIATNAPLDVESKEKMLAMQRVKDRAFMLLSELSVQEQYTSLVEKVKERTHRNLSDSQREAFLNHQLEAIRTELYGDSDDEIRRFRERAEKVNWTDEAKKVFDREIERLGRQSQQSPEYNVGRSYIELLLDLPWNNNSPTSTDLAAAREVLEADHYGLEKVKERIVEQLAIMMNTPDGRAPIICLVGAPGVGKTSLGQSIARALGRKYQRVSLGGLHDESELRGHRRTYIGAMPGRIIDALRRAGTSNPVILLDEIDKTSHDYHGDPQAALLEVLDPEQNCHFHDNYVDVDFDLSKVLFIATANTLASISQPLLDRMEVIDISGYLLEEKVEIARRHLLTRLRDDNALSPDELDVTPEAVTAVIEGYTSESGVRQLEKKLAAIVRKAVMAKVDHKEWPHSVTPAELPELLGVAPYSRDRYEGNDYPGVVMGLAWTSVGGVILYIEASATIAKAEKLTLTGNLGDVMKESAMIALQYVRANASRFGIDPAVMERLALHLHVPEGATPKDGPSAGITMATAIVSAVTGRKVKPRLAMTGEVTLRGRVLPVGGIKEKILAAKRAGAADIILSEQNRKDVEEIPAVYRHGLEFHYVRDIAEVISMALTDEQGAAPLAVPEKAPEV